MTERQEQLFTLLVRQYVKEALPVSSQFLFEKSELSVSSATIRNELVQLETQGLITQPHTSAGRIPTELGYRTYVAEYLKDNHIVLPLGQQKKLEHIVSDDTEGVVKNISKFAANITDLLVFVAFGDTHMYYTGLSHLFSQPEFESRELVYDVSRIVDHFDEVLYKLFPLVTPKATVLIGSQNPFSKECSTVLSSYTFNESQGVIGLLGPMRMDYDTTIGLIQYISDILTND